MQELIVRKNRLKELEAQIELHLIGAFYYAGKAFDEIRQERLWEQSESIRTKTSTFDDYCNVRWKLDRGRVYQIIRAARVVDNLCTNVHKLSTGYSNSLPLTEGVARPLAKTEYTPEFQRTVWETVLSLPEPHTDQQVREIIRSLTPETDVFLPEGKFDVVYMDPPWQYEFSETETRRIENKYRTLKTQEIIEYEAADGTALVEKFADDCVLFMWTTAPKLREAMVIIDSWEFTYRTNAAWDKELIGMGYWFRNQHELLLVATKGSISPPAPEFRVSSVYREKRGEHSKKPTKYYEMIEQMLPRDRYFEAFLRGKPFNEKWHGMGFEMEGSDNGKDS